MSILASSAYALLPLQSVDVFGQSTLLPDVSDFDVPLLDDGEQYVFLDETSGEFDRDYDALALEAPGQLNEAEWWKLALPNFEVAPDPLDIPYNADLIAPRYERERSLGDEAVVAPPNFG